MWCVSPWWRCFVRGRRHVTGPSCLFDIQPLLSSVYVHISACESLPIGTAGLPLLSGSATLKRDEGKLSAHQLLFSTAEPKVCTRQAFEHSDENCDSPVNINAYV